MRALLPEPSAPDRSEPDLHAWYAAEWVDRGGVRVNFVSSVDGAATAAGRSGGLQTPGDHAVFAALRDLADVVLVGAGTARDEGYRPVRFDAAQAAARRRFGLGAGLPIALVSAHLDLDLGAPLFAAAAPDARPIVITSADARPERRPELTAAAEVLVCGTDEVDLAEAVAILRTRAGGRVLCEGGPSLFGQLAGAGLVDELCLSVSPLLAGPDAPRILGGPGWADDGARPLRLVGALEEDGALFLRYRLD